MAGRGGKLGEEPWEIPERMELYLTTTATTIINGKKHQLCTFLLKDE